jgi:hypothetical protein
MAFNLSFSAPAEIKEKERKDENVMSMRKWGRRRETQGEIDEDERVRQVSGAWVILSGHSLPSPVPKALSGPSSLSLIPYK